MEKKVFIVTGAAHGIGRALVGRVMQEGSNVVACDIDTAALEKLREGSQAERSLLLSASSVTVEEQIEKMVESALDMFGRIDVLVNNAGGSENWKHVRETGEFSLPGPIEAYDEEDWGKDIRLNLTSAFLCAKHVIPTMKKQKSGVIINISSRAARTGGNFETAGYAAGKSGLIGLTRRLAKELGPFNIRCNCVLPGFTLSVRNKQVWDSLTKERRDAIIEQIPLRRLAQPSEQVEVVMFLASEDASYITGISLDVNGGIYMTP